MCTAAAGYVVPGMNCAIQTSRIVRCSFFLHRDYISYYNIIRTRRDVQKDEPIKTIYLNDKRQESIIYSIIL